MFITVGIALKWDPLWLFDGDWFKILNVSLCALTNGYFSNSIELFTIFINKLDKIYIKYKIIIYFYI